MRLAVQVVEVYRSKLRNDLPGLEGDEVARKTVEDYVNNVVPPGFLVSAPACIFCPEDN
jgi:maintenance of mitochondrial morphology protein 1